MNGSRCKVCRVLDERDMGQYEDRLVEQWQADRPQRKGYRQLATWLNVMTLRREMDRAGLSTLGDEAESKYERLRRGDTVADEVAENLTNAGIDVSALTNDFVSYGVVRTHLKDCLDAEWERESGNWERDAIDISKGHARSKIADAVRSLTNKGKLTAGGDITVHVTTHVECENCHARVPLEQAIRRGSLCRCEPPQ